MRDKYNEKLNKKLYEERNKYIDTYIENQVMNKQIDGYQPVRMVFLTEDNVADPDWRASVLEQSDNEKLNVAQIDDPSSTLTPKEDDVDDLRQKSRIVFLNYCFIWVINHFHFS